MENGHSMMKFLLRAFTVLGAVLMVVVGFMADKGFLFTLGIAAAWVVVMLIVTAVSEMAWLKKITGAMDALLPLLNTDPDRYIRELSTLLAKVDNPSLQQARDVNLAAAYCRKGAYRVAAESLEKVDVRNVPPAQRSVYWANLALTQFHLNKRSQACTILVQWEASFAPLRTTPHMGPLLAALECFRLLAQGNKEQAREALTELKDTWPADAIPREVAHLERLCK